MNNLVKPIMDYNLYNSKIFFQSNLQQNDALQSSSYFVEVEDKPPENLISFSNDPGVVSGFQFGFLQSFNNDSSERPNTFPDTTQPNKKDNIKDKDLIDNEDDRKYVCDLCRRTFSSQEKHSVHMRCHNGLKPFQCKICFKFYNHQSNLINHIKTHTLERSEFKCSICTKKLDNEESFKNHLRIHSNQKPFKCSYCEKTFNHKSNCSTHEKKHIQPVVYPCPICQKNFKHASNLNGHMKLHQEKQFKCNICSKEFHYKNSYEYHLNKHHKTDDIWCLTCKKVFNCKNSLERHQKIHQDSKKQFYCEKCDKRFNYKNNLKTHMLSHRKTDQNKFLLYLACNFCSAVFLEEESLVEHEDEHNKNGTTSFQENLKKEREEAEENDEVIEKISENVCRVCLQEFHNLDALISHHRVHLCENAENCKRCSEVLKSNFDGTEVIPNEEPDLESHECWVCKNSFKRFENFQIHFKTHIDKNSFECESCPKRFSSSQNFQAHKKTHTTDPTYSCDKCGKIFRYKGSLNYHKKIHADVKGYQCDKCTKQFNFLCNLETHISRLHARD